MYAKEEKSYSAGFDLGKWQVFIASNREETRAFCLGESTRWKKNC